MANNCAACGANLDMVGRTHRCVPRPGASIATPDDVSALSLAAPPDTYKYRNVEQRRAYMRDLMRKRREK